MMASKVSDDELICEDEDSPNDRNPLLNGRDSSDDELLLNNLVQVSCQRPRRRIRFEDALQHAGFGRFQSKLLLLCGWAMCGNCIQSLNSSFVLRLATCEMKLFEDQETWFNIIIYFGMMVGGLLFSCLADWHGRKALLIICLAMSAIFGLLTSFAQTAPMFLAFRFFTGIGIGGNIPVIFSYFGEFQPKSRRGSMLAGLGAFWTIGAILTSGLAWLMIPYKFGIDSKHFHYTSWNVFLSLSCIPSLSAALLFFLMPESPKYLTEIRRDEEAYQILQSIFNDNHPDMLPSEFENFVNPLIWNIDHMDSFIDSARIIQKGDGFWDSFYNFWRIYVKVVLSWFTLFKSSLRVTTLVLIALYLLLSFGYYGFLTWFREVFSLFVHMDKSGGTVCRPVNYSYAADPSERCVPSEVSLRNKFLINVVAVPGCVLTILLVDRIRRNFLLAIGLFASCAVFCFIWLISTGSDAVAFCCVMNGLIVISWNTLNILAVELYPTTLRCTGFGLLTALSSGATVCGIAAFEKLVFANCAIPLVIIVMLFVMCGSFSFLLPNTRSLDLM